MLFFVCKFHPQTGFPLLEDVCKCSIWNHILFLYSGRSESITTCFIKEKSWALLWLDQLETIRVRKKYLPRPAKAYCWSAMTGLGRGTYFSENQGSSWNEQKKMYTWKLILVCLSEKLNIETVIPHFIQIPLCWMSFSPLTAISVAATVNASVIVISFLMSVTCWRTALHLLDTSFLLLPPTGGSS